MNMRLSTQRLALVLLLLGSSACAPSEANQAQVRSAMNAAQLPKVVACWEKVYEASEPSGSYHATVDFTIRSQGVHADGIDDVNLHELDQADEMGDLGRCIETALAQSAPDLPLTEDVRVIDMQLLFTGPPERVDEDSPPKLTGPRANRCAGLYGYWPPRDVATVLAELQETQTEAERYRGNDPNRYARALQHSYDISLEVRQRLHLDLADADPESAERLNREAERIKVLAYEIGARIGCTPPAL